MNEENNLSVQTNKEDPEKKKRSSIEPEKVKFLNEQPQTVEMVSYSGPIPSPDLFLGFEQALPGLADRVMTLSESQSKHRQKIESWVVLFQMSKSIIGLFFALLIVLGGIGTSAFLIIKGKPISGFLSGVTPLGAVVWAFIHQKEPEEKKKNEKK